MNDLAPAPPLHLADLLAARQGWEVEIGPGKGRYILSRAAEQPGWGFVAVEVKSRLCRLIEERARKRGLTNLVVVRDDARRWLARLEPGTRFDRITIHYPDPWWKKKHLKRAVLTPETLDRMVELLAPTGEIYAQTDVFDRASRMLRLLTEHPALANASPSGGLLSGPVTSCTSNREQRSIESGLPVFRMLFVRSSRED